MMALILARTTSSRTDVLRQMRAQFGESDPELWWKIPFVLSLLVVALLLVWLLAHLERRRVQQRVRPQPMKLYLGSLIKLKIPWGDIFRLWQLARAVGLEHPTVLLISATKYDEAVTRYCADGHGQMSRAGVHGQFMAIRDVLFGTGTMTTPAR